MTTTTTQRRRALDMEALAVHYRVAVSTLRDWARADQWRRYPDPAAHGRPGRPRVLFDLDDADRSYWQRTKRRHASADTAKQ
ncbi:MAG: hypothetical protein GEV28_27940 [Actinophytocola sp.]|uniref:hypothetical protein n=1 Tax=Actinophytocola sp. TaxID=1872138 RepID=UPI001323DEEB|nr:hypothetical protein [Actinophytocola sp.]MPZ84018.1 hypothetical protein [Actinophytocola sp.]